MNKLQIHKYILDNLLIKTDTVQYNLWLCSKIHSF